ncbi:MAG TPA: peptidase [Leucothrix mucor]|uniref:Peptidase n=1 Tax=Leucothrix mucor TaxID=45248 RepID=A0A7V2SZC5_LEUMU|nr:peptidase [Leucothrix mucor]
MIISFTHKGLKRFYRSGSKAGIQAEHADKIQRLLTSLDCAVSPDDMDLPSYALHQLKGNKAGIWSVTVRANWRITFRFVGTDIELVNYEDYH